MIKTVVFGYGNVGKAVVDTIESTKDFKLCAIIDDSYAGTLHGDLKILSSKDSLPDVDVAILSVPSRIVPDLASKLLSKKICTVDGFDIHTEIPNLRNKLGNIAKDNNVSAITAAGWDPGTDSIVRVLFEAMAPGGITYTNFGPGMSMGHTVAAKAIDGVKDALSMTIPTGTGTHRRMIYLEIEDGHDFEDVVNNLEADNYFSDGANNVVKVDDVSKLIDTGHAVNIHRKGVSGITNNQIFEFNMSINNPALTAQVLVSSARAVMKQSPGCYTLIEIPPVDFLDISTEDAVKKMV